MFMKKYVRTLLSFMVMGLFLLMAVASLDPNTGAQKDRLNKIRDYLVEKHGFNRKWVDKYYWNILSSIDNGKHLMDRFCPPEEWWVDQMNLKGYH